MENLKRKGLEHYAVTVSGEVRNMDSGKFLKPWDTGKGYWMVHLFTSDTKERVPSLIHRLVAETYLPVVEGKLHVNHKDRDKSNNHVLNLEWCTPQENQEHALSKEYLFTSPEGDRVAIYNMRKFCREMALNNGHMSSVASGKLNSYKGWKLDK